MHPLKKNVVIDCFPVKITYISRVYCYTLHHYTSIQYYTVL